jgi:uncharacterized protein (DUF1800 family)
MKILIPHPKVKHLLDRASFGVGIKPGEDDVRSLFAASEKILPLASVEKPVFDMDPRAMKNDSSRKEIMKEILGKSRQNLMKLNGAWMDRLIKTPSLRERMTFFWHGHFACRTLVPYFAQQQNNVVRTYSMGSFKSLLMAISKDPAMLQFLNNQQNRKDHPNENFAREVMELFTLGRGNYNEEDVKEAARAFTGWGFNFLGEYQFRPRQHDFGTKKFRGEVKDFTGEQIIEAILDDKTTARFITTKLYRHFISDKVPTAGVIEPWADSFYKSGYDIEKLMLAILESEEFNSGVNTGTKIKSPVELLITLMRHTGGEFENPQGLIFLQRALGQVLFYPPNVSGWPAGKAWIDSTSLAFRTSLPMILFGGAETDFQATDDGDANGLVKDGDGKRMLQCKVDWAMLANKFTRSSHDETMQLIESFLLSRSTSKSNRELVAERANRAQNDPEFVKRAFIGFMSLPEYQLC